MTTTVLQVGGMDCDRCAKAVKTLLAGLPTVLKVVAHPPTGRITVTSTSALDDEAVHAATARVGLTLLGR
ncbi:heavy-metal-associated domain-containing protein [Kitasatospora sp. NPDC048365]|uniref:heavy-metal-associated domain-containing protein n=1 Tax=Kitasatospora sp. NPDC048365 TaxID=3364050 RepID=UPI0037224AD4